MRGHDLSLSRSAVGDPAHEWTVVTEARAGEREFLQAGLREVLERLLRESPSRFLRQLPGRETFASSAFAGLPGGWVIKRYGRGSRREDWFERLRGEEVRLPARREFENLLELRELGIRVPKPILWAACSAPGEFCSLLIMSEVVHKRTLREAVSDPSWPRPFSELLALVDGLHAAGWYHRDLYLQHLVLASEERQPSLCLLDVGRCRRATPVRRRWLEKDLAALLHSCPPEVSLGTRLRFLARYLDRRGLSRGRAGRRARVSWMRRIERRRALMASHTPRFGEEQAGT